MIEALASGLPVVSTRVSGSSVLVESTAAGLVVDVGDVDKLAGALKTLLNDESVRTQLGGNARPTYEAHFSLNTLASRMIALYERLLDRKPKQATA